MCLEQVTPRTGPVPSDLAFSNTTAVFVSSTLPQETPLALLRFIISVLRVFPIQGKLLVGGKNE